MRDVSTHGQVVIKYVPYVGDSKRALDEYTSEIFMGGRNTIAMHNTCEDSLLASPLIYDLVILAELCERIQVYGTVWRTGCAVKLMGASIGGFRHKSITKRSARRWPIINHRRLDSYMIHQTSSLTRSLRFHGYLLSGASAMSFFSRQFSFR